MVREDDELFERSMRSLGVEPLGGRRDEPQEEDAEEGERRLFEEAMRDLQAPAGKEADRPAAGPRLTVRRVKARPRGERIDDQIDLHGLKGEEALRRLRHFLAAAAGAGARTVLVITGKGHHSPQGRGVLRRRVEEWIVGQGRRRVRAYAQAPRALGGRGAYVLYLRAPVRSPS